MKKFALILLAAIICEDVGAASAQSYFEGLPGGSGHYNGPYYYAPDPYYPHRYREHYDEDRRYFPPSRRWGRNGCPPHYTVQNGLCKPYRGY